MKLGIVSKSHFSLLPTSEEELRDQLRYRSPKPIDVYWESDGADGSKGVYTSEEGDVLFHLKQVPSSDGSEKWYRFYSIPASSIDGGQAISDGYKNRAAEKGGETEAEETPAAATAQKSIGAGSVFSGFFTAPRKVLESSQEKGQEG